MSSSGPSSSGPSSSESFRVLGLAASATDAEIRKAYRKLSLRYHPDKAGKDVDPVLAADRFHKINSAYEALMDPAARAQAQQQAAEDAAKRERQDKYEGKRRQMADELERSEQAAFSRKSDLLRRRERQETIAKLQEEARNMVLQKQAELRAARNSDMTAARQQAAPDLQPLDKTVRVRFPSSQLSQFADTSPLASPLALALTSQFGPLEHLQFQPTGKKLKREVTALASFVHLKDAWQAVITGSEMQGSGLLEDAYIGWATFEEKRNADGSRDKIYVAPQRVQWFLQNGHTQPGDVGHQTLTPEYEQATLQRLLDVA